MSPIKRLFIWVFTLLLLFEVVKHGLGGFLGHPPWLMDLLKPLMGLLFGLGVWRMYRLHRKRSPQDPETDSSTYQP